MSEHGRDRPDEPLGEGLVERHDRPPRPESDRPVAGLGDRPPVGRPGSGPARDEAPGGPARDEAPGGPARDGGRRLRRGGGRGDRPMVPPAEFGSYYGKPIVKVPVWHRDIAAYLFSGGLAAGSSLLAAAGDLTGRPALRRAGRITALGAVTASAYFLIHDLGRPERFHHMLRVAKPTSPMSVGTWILSAFGPAAGLAAVAEAAPLLPQRGVLGLARRLLPPLGTAGQYGAALTAPALATYTAVLLTDTSAPSWHAVHEELPFVFAGSALASGAGVGLIAAPGDQAGPARRLAVIGGALELYGAHRVETTKGLLSEPYTTGRPGRLLRAGRALTAAGVVGALLGRRSRAASALSGLSLLAASVATRFGIFDAGVASARDPKYVVVPQRERLQRRAADGDAADGGAAGS
jgi:Polysulphide reductase, NrfD